MKDNEIAEVAGAEITVRRDRRAGGVGVVPIAEEIADAADRNFPIVPVGKARLVEDRQIDERARRAPVLPGLAM
jgi:hypothetical protein